MHEFEFVQDLVIIFGLSVVVVLVFQRVRLPSIVGFLIAGALVGPHGLNLIDDLERVEVLAEVGVVLLLFTIGLEFSLAQLNRIRSFALTGGALQVGLTIGATALAGLVFHLTIQKGIYWGFLLALSSTAIVLKILMEREELDSPHGRLVLAILIFQDLIIVPMMMLMPLLAGTPKEGVVDVIYALIRSVVAIGIILVAARWLIPKLLVVVVRAKSREVFVITIILICAGIAWLSEENGLSLALGAFIAGLVISESEYSHQALADIMPFRDSFNSLFFVSIGMLLDGRFFLENMPFILLLTAAVLILKWLVAGGVTLALGYPARVAILVGLALPQVGEFSFVLAKAGQSYGLMSQNDYQLFLVISILSMLLTPFLIQLGPRVARRAEGMGRMPSWFPRFRPREIEPAAKPHRDHVIIAGYGLNGTNVARVLKDAKIPYVVLDIHAETVWRGRAQGEPVYFGDVTQSEVLHQMRIHHARVLVLAVSDPFAARRAIRVARSESPRIHIVARTRYVKEVDELLRLGANEVVPEEFETSLEIFDLVLQQFDVPKRQIAQKKEQIRQEGYALLRREGPPSPLTTTELPVEVEVEYYPLKAGSPFVGKNLAELQIPTKTGVLVAAIIREGQTYPSPTGGFHLDQKDTLVLTGNRDGIQEAINYLKRSEAGRA